MDKNRTKWTKIEIGLSDAMLVLHKNLDKNQPALTASRAC
jgi:hypothetical protein